MNREIKFRIWSKSEKRWIDPEFYHCINSLFVCDDDYVFQQYTGVKDKNGKEIYEGDVITQSVQGFVIDKFVILKTTGEVFYSLDNTAFMVKTITSRNAKPKFPLVNHNGNNEVIANIFENPPKYTFHKDIK